MYNVREIENEFLNELQKYGIPPHDGVPIHADGKKHRYRIEGDRKHELSGEYIIYLDEWPAGWFKSYSAKHNVPYKTWSLSSKAMGFSEEEKRTFREAHEKKIIQRTEEEAQKRRFAAETAKKIWENATTDGVMEHPYITKKGICNVSGLKLLGREIIIPLFDIDGTIHSVQKIPHDGEKRFLTGGRKRGCFYRLNGDGKYTFLCEGVATALSVRDATGCACVIAFDAGNLSPVIEDLGTSIPNLILASDNDTKTTGNPGFNYAIEAASEKCIPVVVPQFENPTQGSDWNDYVLLFGVEKACEDIHRQIEAYLNDTAKRAKFEFPDTVQNKVGKNIPLGTFENFDYLLRYHGYRIRYNEISHGVDIAVPNRKYGSDNCRNAALADIHSLMTRSWLKIPDKPLKSYIHKISDTNSYNPAQEWILRCKWNGKDAISDLCATLKLVPNSLIDLFHKLVRKWLISAVAAAFSRGFDDVRPFWSRGVLVLQGAQSIGKTSWLRRLAPNGLFAEGLSLSLDDKDSLRRAVSSWIVEFGELDGTFKKTDMARLKAFVSSQYDELRRPYAESSEKLSRRTVFCASVNRSDILQDDTGSSRWWILPLLSCDARHNVDIGQLWAHVYRLYLDGEAWWLTQNEERDLSLQNEQFTPTNKFEDLILSKFEFGNYSFDDIQNTREMTTMEVLKECGINDPPSSECISASSVLRRLTGHPSKRVGKEGKRVFRMPN